MDAITQPQALASHLWLPTAVVLNKPPVVHDRAPVHAVQPRLIGKENLKATNNAWISTSIIAL